MQGEQSRSTQRVGRTTEGVRAMEAEKQGISRRTMWQTVAKAAHGLKLGPKNV